MSSERFLEYLSAVTESLRPLTSADIDLPAMRQQLIESGLTLNISEEDRLSLAESQFRGLNSGRGVGMVAVLGPVKAEALLSWCHQKAEGGPKLKKSGKATEGSEGRGLRQLAADLIQLVVTPKPSQDDLDQFCLRMNQRVRKGLLWENRGDEGAKATINQAFQGIPEPEKTFSSVPPGSVADLWQFLATPLPTNST